MAQLAAFFQTPGANLQPADKIVFEEIKVVIDRATDALLMRSDWESNIRCSDLVNQQLSSEIIGQVIFLLRRKLSSRQAKQVYLTIALVESLVKNCGTRLHAAINNEAFMNEMCKVARKYVGLRGPENLEVAETCLDVLQAWGEAFLPRQRQFPNIVKAYQDLRVEGLPFRKQYDPTRVPIFTPASTGGAGDETDIILAAAMASAAIQDQREATGARLSGERRAVAGGGQSQQPSSSASEQQQGAVFEPLCTSIGILRDMLSNASTPAEIRENDFLPELVSQVEDLQRRLMAEIETALSEGSDSIDIMFKLNDDAQLVLSVVKELKTGASLQATVAQLAGLSPLSSGGDHVGVESASSASHHSAPASGASSLLDFGDDGFFGSGSAAPQAPHSQASQAAAQVPPQAPRVPAPLPAPKAPSMQPPPSYAASVQRASPPTISPPGAAKSSPNGTASSNGASDPFGPSTSIDDILLSSSSGAAATPASGGAKTFSAIDELLSMSSSSSHSAPMSGWGATQVAPVDSIPSPQAQMQQQQQMYFNSLPAGWPGNGNGSGNGRNSIGGGGGRNSFTALPVPPPHAPSSPASIPATTPPPQSFPSSPSTHAPASTSSAASNPFDLF